MKITVVYSIEMLAEIEVNEGENINDVISNIEIPENDTSKYNEDTFDVKCVLDENGNELEGFERNDPAHLEVEDE